MIKRHKPAPSYHEGDDVHIIFKCPSCKGVTRRTYTAKPIHESIWRRVPGAPRFSFVREDEEGRMAITDQADAKSCPRCGDSGPGFLMDYKPVIGTLDESVICDARCTGARGPACNCSCGGENHGKAWGR